MLCVLHAFFEARPRLLWSLFGSLFHLPYEKLNVTRNMGVADRHVAVPFVYALLSALPRARKNGA